MAAKIKSWQWQPFLKQSLATHHSRIVTLGLAAGLFYLPAYLKLLTQGVLTGSSTIILNFGFLYLGLNKLWQNRAELKQAAVLRDDRIIGHMLVVASAFWLPFCYQSASLQAFVWMLVLIGIAWSSFTPTVFGRFPLACAMILASMYPDFVFLSNAVWRALTGPYLLENSMAWLGSQALQLIGQSAVSQGRFIQLPEGAVEVASACTGFDMAFVLVGVSFLLGLYLKQSWQRTGLAMLVGVATALILNIPRIMLLVFAAVYWGEESFDFWHGLWGGQIFSGIMFTIYYYAAMAIFQIYTKSHKT